MSIITATHSFNMDRDVYIDLDSQIVQATATDIILRATNAHTQHYSGTFALNPDGSVASSSVITGFEETLADGSLWWKAEGINIVYGTFVTSVVNDDTTGLEAAALVNNDTLVGSGSADLLLGFNGDDLITGNAGNDVLGGNAGNDSLSGGQGSDVIGGGKDRDVLNGNAGADTVNGNLGNDIVQGGKDDDFVRGGQGDDTVAGGFGNDTLSGDLGDDILTGGDGADVFVLSAGTGHDTITDYQDGVDRIQLAGLSFAQLQVTADANGDTMIAFGTSRVLLSGVSPSAIDASDFIF